MFKSLANILMPKAAEPAPVTAPAKVEHEIPEVIKDDNAPIYQSLAMTEEMREALFPTNPRMVSAIFERPTASSSPAPASPQAAVRPQAGDEGFFPIV